MLSRTTGQSVRQRRLALSLPQKELSVKSSVRVDQLCRFEKRGFGISPEGRARIDAVLNALECERASIELNEQRSAALSGIGRRCAVRV